MPPPPCSAPLNQAASTGTTCRRCLEVFQRAGRDPTACRYHSVSRTTDGSWVSTASEVISPCLQLFYVCRKHPNEPNASKRFGGDGLGYYGTADANGWVRRELWSPAQAASGAECSSCDATYDRRRSSGTAVGPRIRKHRAVKRAHMWLLMSQTHRYKRGKELRGEASQLLHSR
jgi:hypothetical protein